MEEQIYPLLEEQSIRGNRRNNDCYQFLVTFFFFKMSINPSAQCDDIWDMLARPISGRLTRMAISIICHEDIDCQDRVDVPPSSACKNPVVRLYLREFVSLVRVLILVISIFS
jgi:hypothetical protein